MEMQEVKGVTYSVEHYNQFNETGDKNYFEEIIDAMILDGISGMNDTFRNAIRGLSKDKKRMTILSLLDKDLNLFKRIKALTDKNIGKMDHIKDIILMLREYVKVGEVEKKKFGEVMTPLELVKEMLATLPEEVWSNPNLKWLDPANGTGPYPIMVIYKLMIGLAEWEPDAEKRYKHIVENMIYVCELQPKNMFLYMCAVDPFDTYKLNIYTGSFLEGAFDKHMKDVWGVEKFDIVIGNPPFNQMIDMSFVQKSYNISESVLFVHPSTWLLDEKGKQRAFNETKDLIKNNLKEVQLFNGNGIFNINLFVPCSITYIDKNFTGKIKVIDKMNDNNCYFDSIYEINKYADENYTSIKNKVKPIADIDNVWNHRYNEGIFYANIAQHRGNHTKSGKELYKDDFYTILTKDDKPITEKTKHLWYGFENESECLNFIEYLKTNTARFLLSIYKNNSQVCRGELEIIPWLDFSQEWTDDKLHSYFNFDTEEISFIEKNIPKYY